MAANAETRRGRAKEVNECLSSPPHHSRSQMIKSSLSRKISKNVITRECCDNVVKLSIFYIPACYVNVQPPNFFLQIRHFEERLWSECPAYSSASTSWDTFTASSCHSSVERPRSPSPHHLQTSKHQPRHARLIRRRLKVLSKTPMGTLLQLLRSKTRHLQRQRAARDRGHFPHAKNSWFPSFIRNNLVHF